MVTKGSSPKLNPEAVRRRASSIVGGCVEVPSKNDSICTFLVGGEGGSVENLARVTIYCDTGTIATGRVLGGSVRHCFRKNVTSLDVVERALRQPADLPAINWHLVGPTDDEDENDDRTCHSVPKNLELIDVGMAILRGEREKLVQHIEGLEVVKSELSPKSVAASTTGMEFQFSLPAGPMKHVDRCLGDIQTMGKLVRGVSTNGLGTVFLYGNGGVAYTPNIPRALYQRLSQLRNSKLHASRPCYVSLGTRERYFVAFFDGTFSYKGPKGLDKELKKMTKAPRSVAFGTNYDTFFVVKNDGTFRYMGRIPTDLEKKLVAWKNRTDLSCINLGPSGEWFLRSQDGRVAWGGGTAEMEEAIQELLHEDHALRFLDFGENGSYFVSYD